MAGSRTRTRRSGRLSHGHVASEYASFVVMFSVTRPGISSRPSVRLMIVR
jgi:hypothetical protein